MMNRQLDSLSIGETKRSFETCHLCSTGTPIFLGRKTGHLRAADEFEIFHCAECSFSFVANPRLDYQNIYSEQYYRGLGADPLIDYVFELENPAQTVRAYEWKGIVDTVRSYLPVSDRTRWLDFGAGNGGLVRYLRSEVGSEAWAYEHGWIAKKAQESGIPFLNDAELVDAAGSFDVVTAIEVFEHVSDPLLELRRIRSLLRPGGLLFFTTGNAEPHRHRLLRWPYLIPDIHISLFEPLTLNKALERSGFRPEFRNRPEGFGNIIRYKVLKALGVKKRALWEQMLPWGILSTVIDSRVRVSAHPVGWAI